MAGMAVRRKELQNAESRKSNGGNGRIEGMADRMVEWQTEMATYVLFTVHTDDDDDDTLIFYSIDRVGYIIRSDHFKRFIYSPR